MANQYQDRYDSKILELVNAERAKHGLSQLKVNQKLDQVSDAYAQRLGDGDFYSHTDPDTQTKPWDRARDAGYEHWETVGENLGFGYRTPETAVEGWMNSPSHRAAILHEDFTHAGIGYYYMSNDTGVSNWTHYWVLNFSTETTPNNPAPRQPASLNLSGNSRANSLKGASGADTLKGFGGADRLKGLAGDDLLLGHSGKDRLWGNNGNDVLKGGTDNDKLIGGAGHDSLYGNRGNDTLVGGTGNDKLIGADVRNQAGNEVDTLIGKQGQDDFYVGTSKGQLYDDGKPSTVGIENYAFIKDFRRSEGDRIVLHGSAEDYVSGARPRGAKSGLGLFLKSGGENELVAIIRGQTSGLSLTSNAFVYE